MKIAILTQPLISNYGGVLQNYALQQVLIKLGHTPITLEKDYHQYISHFRLFIELPKRWMTKYVIRKRKHIFSESCENKRGDKARKILKPFVFNYINHEYIISHNSIEIMDYYAFIVGSDQIWRPMYNYGLLDNMYLSFIPKKSVIKRIAYAASFGTGEWEYDDEQTKKYSKLIQRFDAVSTREIDGVDLCQKYLGYKDAVSVLDPTLLLDKTNYLELCSKVISQGNHILFAYILDKNPSIIEFLEEIAKQKGLNLKLVSAHADCYLSVEEWLAMFRDAKCVITDSFHGTVFSIIFKKEFYTIANQSRGGSRFTSLLSQLSLTDRMLDSISDIAINKNIDWSYVNDKLSCLKDYSINFLRTNLS